MNNFNLIAPVYDALARLIFKDSLILAQKAFLDKISASDSVLILGGGSGEILEYIPKCKKVTFLDKSKKMLSKAEKRTARKVSFVMVDFLIDSLDGTFDVVICPFFLDCFNRSNLRLAVSKCKEILKDDGIFIVCDFQATHSNKLLLIIMHLFFRLFTNLESSRLKNIHQEIVDFDFKEDESKFFHRNQVFSRLYRNL